MDRVNRVMKPQRISQNPPRPRSMATTCNVGQQRQPLQLRVLSDNLVPTKSQVPSGQVKQAMPVPPLSKQACKKDVQQIGEPARNPTTPQPAEVPNDGKYSCAKFS